MKKVLIIMITAMLVFTMAMPAFANGYIYTGTSNQLGSSRYNTYYRVGWQQINGKWYYIGSLNGNTHRGWLLSGGHWYYMDPNIGVMITGYRNIDGTWHYFNTKGVCLW